MKWLRLAIAAFALVSVSVSQAASAPSVPSDPAKVKPVQPGAPAPAFNARTASGEPFRFDPASLQKPALLIFYRGGWCPYCNAHLSALRTTRVELEALGYEVLFLSADRPERLVDSLKEKDLGYTLLSDASMNAARAYGVAFRVDDATFQQYKKFNIDLEAASGETHHELPVPAVFIVDRNGVVRYSHWNPDYKVRLSGEELLEAARAAKTPR